MDLHTDPVVENAPMSEEFHMLAQVPAEPFAADVQESSLLLAEKPCFVRGTGYPEASFKLSSLLLVLAIAAAPKAAISLLQFSSLLHCWV